MYLNSNDENLFKRQVLENKISYLFNHATIQNKSPLLQSTPKKEICEQFNEIWSNLIR